MNSNTFGPGDLLTIVEVAALLRCKPSTVRAWLTHGRLRRTKIGRLTRIFREDVEAFVFAGRAQNDEHTPHAR